MRVFEYSLHVELWEWLAENPDSDKYDWPGWSEFKLYPAQGCFACEYVKSNCDKCPLDWDICLSRDSLYNQWWHADLKEKAKIAKQISEVEVKEGVEWR